jgi:DNA-binding response OmpR family regulator
MAEMSVRILIIEDEKKIADFIKRGLKEEGYAADVAYDGEQGYFLATANEYDLIILDLMLPKIEGTILCRTLRAQKIITPIIMLTAKDKMEDKIKGLDAGATDYVTKPFAFEELLARIRAQSRRSTPVTTKLQAGDLTLDLLTHQVKRGDQEILLTAKEFSLLEYMMRNAGRVVTRPMISGHVWDIHFDTATNLIDVHISYLRQKVELKGLPKIIHTVRGRGYRLQG